MSRETDKSLPDARPLTRLDRWLARLVWSLALLACMVSAGPAYGQSSSGRSPAPIVLPSDKEPPARAVTMPVVRKNDGALYPTQALSEGFFEEVEVPLLITIDPTGAVTQAVLERPVGHGFDEAALAAAQKLEFAPATRDGKPVASRTRFVYRFAPPPAALSGRVVSLVGSRE